MPAAMAGLIRFRRTLNGAYRSAFKSWGIAARSAEESLFMTTNLSNLPFGQA
jgi:hypothetical protein